MNTNAQQVLLDFESAETIGVDHGAPPSAKTQCGKILRVLIEARGQFVPLYRITPLAAQYSARIAELRALGFRIENRIQTVGKERHSWFRLSLLPVNGADADEVTADDSQRAQPK